MNRPTRGALASSRALSGTLTRLCSTRASLRPTALVESLGEESDMPINAVRDPLQLSAAATAPPCSRPAAEGLRAAARLFLGHVAHVGGHRYRARLRSRDARCAACSDCASGAAYASRILSVECRERRRFNLERNSWRRLDKSIIEISILAGFSLSGTKSDYLGWHFGQVGKV